MRKILPVAAAVIALSGCLGVESFTKSNISAVTDSRTLMAFIEKYPDWETSQYLAEYLSANQDIAEYISDTCSPDQRLTVAPTLVPVIASFGKLLFDLSLNENLRELEALKRSAQGSYSARAFIDLADFKKQRCIAFARYQVETVNGPAKLGLLYIAKIVPLSNDAFTITPVFIKAENAFVVTAATTPPSISLSLAISIKAIAAQGASTALIPVAHSVISIPNLAIGPGGGDYRCRDDCPTTDLIPYPKSNIDPISVTISIAETGRVGIDFDKKAAEIKAIREALGPALQQSLRTSLSE